MATRASKRKSSSDRDSELLDKAAAQHGSGNLMQALSLYRRYLKHDPDNAQVLHAVGGLYYQLEDFEAAGRYLLKAHEAAPEELDLLSDLGAFRTMRGEYEAAIPCLREVVRKAPGHAQAWYNLGMALYGLQRLPDAVGAFARAAEVAPEFVGAYCNQARVLLELGQLKQAEQAYRKGIGVQPHLAEAHYGLGEVLVEQGRIDLAADAFRRAHQLEKDNPKIILRLADSLGEIGQTEEGIRLLQTAAQKHPEIGPLHSTLGTLLKNAGRIEEAEAAYLKALTAKPQGAEAWYGLSRVRKFTPADSGLIARMEKLLESQSLRDADRKHVHFALGKIYDDCEEYDKAFAHFEAGNEMQHKRCTYDRASHEKLVDQLIATFDEATFEQSASLGSTEELPIFIVGMPRSGTTLVEQIVASHPQVAAAGELRYFGNIAGQLSQLLKSDAEYPVCCRELDAVTAKAIIANYLRLLRRHSATARLVTDKMPENYLDLGMIRMLFPEAPIIHCRRHPLDVCLSIFFQAFTEGNDYAYDLTDIGRRYLDYQRLMKHWRTVLPGPFMEIQYEDLVADQAVRSRELVEFCGLEWDDACLEFHKTQRAVKTASNWQVRQPIYTSSRQRWRNYARHLRPLMDLLGISAESS